MSDDISDFFEVEHHDISDTTDMSNMIPVVHSDNVSDNAKSDYRQTRESLKHIIKKGTEMIDKLAKVTDESESPRAFEVMAGYLKQIAEMNKMLFDLNKSAKDVLEIKDDNIINTNNDKDKLVYVGSTEELQKFLKEQRD